MAKAKAIILAVLVIVVASVAGYYAAIHYMQTKAVVQAEKDKQDEANKTKLQEQADKETAQKEKVRQKLSAPEAHKEYGGTVRYTEWQYPGLRKYVV